MIEIGIAFIIMFSYIMISGIIYELIPRNDAKYDRFMLAAFWIFAPTVLVVLTPIWIGNKIGKTINNHIKGTHK